jgi:hypothetical protein
MKTSILVGTAAMLIVTAGLAMANVGWKKTFTDVADWAVGYDPGGHARLSSDGSVAHLYVNASSNMASFIPAPGLAPMIPYKATHKKAYQLVVEVAGLTPSTSYDIALDLFNERHEYISTVWGVYPSKGSTTKTGVITISLADIDID